MGANVGHTIIPLIATSTVAAFYPRTEVIIAQIILYLLQCLIVFILCCNYKQVNTLVVWYCAKYFYLQYKSYNVCGSQSFTKSFLQINITLNSYM